MRVGTFPAPWGVQTSTERSEVGANTPLLRSRRQTPLWRLSACTGEVYSEEELYRIVYGNYLEEVFYGKRPLAKLTSDIMKELLNTCYGLDW